MTQPHLALLQASECLKRLPVDAFELFLSRSESLKIEVKSQSLDAIQKSADVGIAVRVQCEGRLGFSFSTALDSVSLQKMCARATDLASISERDEEGHLQLLDQDAKPLSKFDDSIQSLPLEERIELTRTLEKACLDSDPRIKQTRKTSTRYALYETELLDQAGNHLAHRATHFSASISCKADSPSGDSQMGGEMQGSWKFSDLEVKGVGKRAAQYATELLGAGAITSRRCPAVLRNGLVIELMEFLVSSFSGEEVFKGRSLLAGKIGGELFSKLINIEDRANSIDGEFTAPFDGEGSLSRATELVRAGALKTYLTDRKYSRKLKLPCTASAHRSLKSVPAIGASDLRMSPGNQSLSELIKTMRDGILVTEFLGLHTANPVTGEFSVGASGICVENGELTRPVKGFAVSGNVLALLSRVVAVGSDSLRYGGTTAPSLLIEELVIGGNA